jgi:hypothetical protein
MPGVERISGEADLTSVMPGCPTGTISSETRDMLDRAPTSSTEMVDGHRFRRSISRYDDRHRTPRQNGVVPVALTAHRSAHLSSAGEGVGA